MLAVLDKRKKDTKSERPKGQDIIVKKLETKVIENEDGSVTIKKEHRNVNLSKMINETKKLVKQTAAQEIIAKLEEIKGVYTK